MGMSSYIMDCEEQFANSVNLRIGGCEHITELHMALTRDKCWNDIAHMSDNEKLEFVEELWGEFWSDYA
tara:strand:- start:269 stop:475 length:207 start_codon:yes stop_codon:yes gene_type:complete